MYYWYTTKVHAINTALETYHLLYCVVSISTINNQINSWLHGKLVFGIEELKFLLNCIYFTCKIGVLPTATMRSSFRPLTRLYLMPLPSSSDGSCIFSKISCSLCNLVLRSRRAKWCTFSKIKYFSRSVQF